MSSKPSQQTPTARPRSAHPRRPWSLAARLTLWYAGSAFALVLLATGFLYSVLDTSLDREKDSVLADQVHILGVLLRERPDDEIAFKQEIEWESGAREHGQIYVRLLHDGGRPDIETPGMSVILPPDWFPAPIPYPGLEQGTNLRLGDGKSFRICTVQVAVGNARDAGCTLQVGVDRSHEDALLAAYRRSLWLVLGGALLACSGGGYWIARRGIRPIEEIAQTACRIRSTTLDERITAGHFPAELATLATTFNEMLDRLEGSFGRLARFSADIAHELRTPVNNLRGEVEVALGKPRSPDEYRETLASCLEEAVRLSRIIDSLLFLARAENPRIAIDRERIDLGRELLALQEFYEAAASEAGVRLRVVAGSPATALVNRPLFQRAVGNLVENALVHTPLGGTVTLAATSEESLVRVEVADTGAGIPRFHLPYLFDRFYRVDQARAASSGGVGLGLSIVKTIVQLHGGSASIDSEVGRGTRVALVFPSPGEPDHHPSPNMTGM